MGGGNPFDGPYGQNTTEYEKYLRTEDLLKLQKAPETRSHPDELLFQTVHQVEELWMKATVHELGECDLHLAAERLSPALAAMQRACNFMNLCEQQLLLFETMQPAAYLAIRQGLGHGSGLDSPGFKRINEVAPKLWVTFENCLNRRGCDLLAMYEDPHKHPHELAIAEAFVTFDSAMQRFKYEHIFVVRRIIGNGTASLRGNPIEMLERSAKLCYFPMLWAARERLFADFKALYPSK